MKYLCLWIYIYFVHTSIYMISRQRVQKVTKGPPEKGNCSQKWHRYEDLCMGIGKNKGTPKWMVYNGNPYFLMDDLEVPLFSETPVYTYVVFGVPPHLALTCLLSNTIPILRLLFIFPNKCQLLSVAIQLLISNWDMDVNIGFVWFGGTPSKFQDGNFKNWPSPKIQVVSKQPFLRFHGTFRECDVCHFILMVGFVSRKDGLQRIS